MHLWHARLCVFSVANMYICGNYMCKHECASFLTFFNECTKVQKPRRPRVREYLKVHA